ncbi:MAG: glycosyltransferase family 2 protein [Balneolaceae bacterium]|nr:glycosyltransferase family 2 protein [Balneolaceae bacterium]
MTFSQIIITYNSEKHIRKCLDSVLNQSVLPDEILIGDDCSSDNTRQILEEYKKKHPSLIRILFHKKNLGIAGNLNTCAREASSTYIGFLAGDDWLLPGKNEKQFGVIKKYGTKYGLYFSDFLKVHINENKSRINTNVIKEGDYQTWIARRLFSIRTFWLSKDLFLRIKGFDERLFIYEDWHFRLKLSLVTKFKWIPGVFSAYQVHDEGIHNVSKDSHLENMFQIVDLLSEDNVDVNLLNLVRASIFRRQGERKKASKLDPHFPFYKTIYRFHYYVRNIFKNG